MIKVFGHQSPDTDATCSAIIWAWYLNEHTGAKATPYVLGDLNTETQFVLSHWGVPTPERLETLSPKDTVAIVDTNNPQELPDTIHEATVTTIIDHHKLVGGLTSHEPIAVTVRPLAATASVLFELMRLEAAALPKPIAGLALSCILSDTLAFRSPTTTPHDKDIAEQLAATLNVNIDEYATAMFNAKSDVSAFSDKGLLTLDSKKSVVGSLNLRISVIETTNPNLVLERRAGIVSAIEEMVAEEADVDEVLFFIVDILNEAATVLCHNQRVKDIIEKSFSVTVEADTETLPGIVSRKKQILPALTVS